MKKFVALFFATILVLTSCKNDSANEQDFELSQEEQNQNYVAYDGSYQPENMSPAREFTRKASSIDTENKKDDREEPMVKTDIKPLQHAEVDSALIINNYEDKRFIKERVERPKQKPPVVSKSKQSISGQLKSLEDKRISINITEDVGIKDAIMEVSRLAGIDVEIDPDVEGSIILSLTNAKISDVLERMAELADLNITVRNDVVRFYANKSYTKNYSISFLENNSNGNSGNGSTANSTSTVGGVGNNGGLNNNFNNNQNNNNQLPASNLNNNTGIHGTSMWEQFENGLKYIVSQKKGTEYSINKQAGVVVLRAPVAVHKDVEEYIAKIKKVATTQILVEVRLVEVGLEDEFSSGIDFAYKSLQTNVSGSFLASQTSSLAGAPFAATLNPRNTVQGLTGAIQFLQTFGTTKTISSPRLNVMNNQQAKLSFASDYVYFSIQPQIQNQFAVAGTSLSTPNTPIVVQSTMRTVPIGVILNLQATADNETNEITMNINPVLSTVSKTINDPAASFLSGVSGLKTGTNVVNEVPVVEKKELNSTLRIKSGDIMVIGGFNEEKTIVRRVGIPLLKDVPLLRYLFSSDKKYVKNFETVIFIKATIVNAENPIVESDRKFFNDFA